MFRLNQVEGQRVRPSKLKGSGTNGTRSSSNPRYIKSLENHAKSPLLGLFQRNLFFNSAHSMSFSFTKISYKVLIPALAHVFAMWFIVGFQIPPNRAITTPNVAHFNFLCITQLFQIALNTLEPPTLLLQCKARKSNPFHSL